MKSQQVSGMQFRDLVDLGELRILCEHFSEITGISTAILDLEGNILVATDWREICTRFHRVHPMTAARCRESDTVLAGQLQQGQTYNVYRCRNGLVDVAVPIHVGGEHVANFFMGQFVFEPPDREYFLQQAERAGFDKTAYLAALDMVPIYSDQKVRSLMQFLSRLARIMGEMGLARQRVEASNARLQGYQEHLEDLVRERTAELNRAQEIARIGSWRRDLRTNALSWSDEMYRLMGLSPGEPAVPDYDFFLAQVHPEQQQDKEHGITSLPITYDNAE